MVKTTKDNVKVETPTSKASYVKAVTGEERSASPHEPSRGSSPVATGGYTHNQSNKEKKREKARQKEDTRTEESVRANLQAEIVKANAATQAASDRQAEADRRVVEQAEIIKSLKEQMDTAASQKTAPSAASTPVRGEDSQAKAVDTQAQDTPEIEEGAEKEQALIHN